MSGKYGSGTSRNSAPAASCRPCLSGLYVPAALCSSIVLRFIFERLFVSVARVPGFVFIAIACHQWAG